MSYFEDLTPHTYTPTDGETVLNVGWLDSAHPFPRGQTSPEFRDALRRLCERPVHLHRGLHYCQFCPGPWPSDRPERMGNGQIRIKRSDGVWYAAPTMVHHYVSEHGYLPPAEFMETVLHPAAIAEEAD